VSTTTALARAEAEITLLKVELLALGPVVAAATELRDACAWQRHASCEAEDEQACTAVDRAIEAIVAAVDARQVADPPPATAEDVAGFLAMETPGDEVAS
jgi:hypothetical protein